jgi:cytochrome c peroxidase
LIQFNNNYFKALATLDESAGVPKELHGPRYIETPVVGGGRLKMVPSDLVLLQEKPLLKWVKVYCQNKDKFFQDFSSAFHRLEELGTINLIPMDWASSSSS